MLEHYLNLAIRAMFVENMALVFFLGICSFLAVSRNDEVPSRWELNISDATDNLVKQFSGEGTIDPIRWDGRRTRNSTR